jgi:2,3-bisphosphoglycerate-independent phosphoglycerate mutase
MKNTCVLLILDGWGIGKRDESNPIYLAGTKTLDMLAARFPAGSLQASGLAIGLPWDTAGSSEVGHATIGAGRAVANENGLASGEIRGNLGEAVAGAGKNQMRIAESVRYRGVTFYLNGMREAAYENEYRVEIPSREPLEPEKHPEMMAEAVTERILLALADRGYDFLAATYANPDVIGKTANFESATRAVRALDTAIDRIARAVLAEDHTLIITSTHGNLEYMLDLGSGKPEGKDTTNPVPFYLIGKRFERKNGGGAEKLQNIGLLSDVAPTILEILGVKKPADMTGESLLPQLV